MAQSTVSDVARVRRRRRHVELACVLLLSAGGVATTWCGFQASLWSGRMSSSYARAGGLRVDSAKVSTLASQQLQVDVAAFIAWANAYEAKNSELADFLRARFRPEFRAAFDAWAESMPLKNPDAAQTPFVMPGYHNQASDRAAQLAADAERVIADGEFANHQSDRYVRITVLFSLALFFAGVAQQFREPTVQAGLAVVSLALMVFGIVLLTALPRSIVS